MTDYRRHPIAGGTFFFTVNLVDRGENACLVEHIVTLRTAFQTVRARRPFSIDAIVILPDHLHTIWTLPESDHDFQTRWSRVKGEFSRRLPNREWRSRSRVQRRERGIWQRRYWEHAIRDDRDFRQHVDYIHWNPVKHGWVDQVSDWPYSSFHRYVQRGIYPLDWGGTPDLAIEAGE